MILPPSFPFISLYFLFTSSLLPLPSTFQAGGYVQDDLVSIIIAMVSENTELHTYSVQRLFLALCADISQQTLSKVAVWSIGEFGDLLLSGQMEEELKDVSFSNLSGFLKN